MGLFVNYKLISYKNVRYEVEMQADSIAYIPVFCYYNDMKRLQPATVKVLNSYVILKKVTKIEV